MTNSDKRHTLIVAALLGSFIAALYTMFFFPHAYFRHDDWLHLGNNVRRLPYDWTLPWRGTLHFLDHETKWFFRPMVHFTVWAFLKLFGLSHLFWLIALSFLTAVASLLGSLSVYELTKSKTRATLFSLFFLLSFHIHFGSITWVGEGIMNCPQLLVLSLSLYFFSRSLAQPPRSLMQWLALFFFVIALGFKESSFFLPVLLTGICLRSQNLSQTIRRLSPFFVTLVAYLFLRFWLIPMNRSYLPHFELAFYTRPLAILGGSIILPWIAVQLVELFRMKDLSALRPDFLNFTFLLLFPGLFLLILPHLGHDFFSPGWLLLPGFVGAFVFSLTKRRLPSHSSDIALGSVFILLFSLVPTVWKLNKMNWWDWHRPQRQLVTLLSEAPSDTHEIVISNCSNKSDPDTLLERVVGGREHIGEMWNFFHGTVIPINVISCQTDLKERAGALYLWWRFPEFSRRSFQ
jgi:hypothetical protein